jgi:CRISPR-associated protein Csb2
MFSALVAAAGSTSDMQLPKAARDALQWLLEQGAPEIALSQACARSAPEVHMPSNPHEDEVWQKTKDGKPRKPLKSFNLESLIPAYRKRAALPIPAVVPLNPVVHFIWPNSDPGDWVESLQEICHGVTYLGRSRSIVSATVVDDPPKASYVQDDFGDVQLRVPGSGRLTYLCDKYKDPLQSGKPVPSGPKRYRMISYQSGSVKTLHTIFDRCWIFQPQLGDPLLTAVSTVKVTQALRKALISCIEQSQRSRGLEPKIPPIVHGHTAHPHCAYLTLPFVHPRQRYADGSIKGVAVFIPVDAQEEDLSALAQGFDRLQHNGLGIPGIGTWRIEEVPADDSRNATLDPNTWTRPARLWTTATPMVFGHFPKSNKGGEAKVVLDSLEMIGIQRDNVVEILVDRYSPLHGAPPSWCFKACRETNSEHQSSSWIRHVTLRFDQHVRGPILLGSMRHFGLGLMRPIEEP